MFIFLTIRPWVSKWYSNLTLKMPSAWVVKTIVTNKRPSQDSNHPDDLFQSRHETQMLQLSKTKSCSRRGSYGTKETVNGMKPSWHSLSDFCANIMYIKLSVQDFWAQQNKENNILIFAYPVLRNIFRFLNWRHLP